MATTLLAHRYRQPRTEPVPRELILLMLVIAGTIAAVYGQELLS